MDLIESYRNCVLCPRQCRVNRIAGEGDATAGYCGETDGPLIQKKIRLLVREGIALVDGRLTDSDQLYDFKRHA